MRYGEKWHQGHKCAPVLQLHTLQEVWALYQDAFSDIDSSDHCSYCNQLVVYDAISWHRIYNIASVDITVLGMNPTPICQNPNWLGKHSFLPGYSSSIISFKRPTPAFPSDSQGRYWRISRLCNIHFVSRTVHSGVLFPLYAQAHSYWHLWDDSWHGLVTCFLPNEGALNSNVDSNSE